MAAAAGWAPRGRAAGALVRAYSVVRTAAALRARGAARAALQFPDALLRDSFAVAAALEAALAALAAADGGAAAGMAFVLGDTSYGECCVDEVAAQHLLADVVVHYGPACLSPTRELPVLYVFPQDASAALVAGGDSGGSSLRSQVEFVRHKCPAATRVVVLYDVEMHEEVRGWAEACEGLGYAVDVATPRLDVTSVAEPCGDAEPRAAACKDKSGDGAGGTCDGGCRNVVSGGECCGSESGAARFAGASSAKLNRQHQSQGRVGGGKHSDESISGTGACHGSRDAVTCGPLVFPLPEKRAGDDAGDVSQPWHSDESETAFLWLSREATPTEECIPLRNAALQYTASTCAGFYVAVAGSDSESAEPVSTGRLLGKRYALVEKARDAERVGIVAGTLGVSGNLAVIERVKRVVEAAGRRWYLLMVGKPNAAKLGNFAEMDVFVLVACAQNSLIDCKDYLRPVLTPFEIEVALGGRDWFSSPYSPDFADMLRLPPVQSADCDDNGLPLDAKAGGGEGPGLELAPRADWTVAVGGAGAAAGFLASREWRGLDAHRDGDGTAVDELATRAVSGRSGVAGGYAGEG